MSRGRPGEREELENPMSGSKPRYYVTTPIYYVNDVPHIGHAYTTLACDALARFMRLDGLDVMFLTGTDEHGQKVEKSAQEAGMEPRAFTDMVSENFRELAEAMNFSHDDFIRTTEPPHHRASQATWPPLKDNRHIHPAPSAGRAPGPDLAALLFELPAIQGCWPDPDPEGLLVFIGCDSAYLLEHGLPFAVSLDRNSPGTRLHVHLVNPDSAAEAILRRIAGTLTGTTRKPGQASIITGGVEVPASAARNSVCPG